MQTLEEIRREGLDALRERLGQAGMIRFLAQFEKGDGDYAKERHDSIEKWSLDSIREMLDQSTHDATNDGQ